MLRRFRALPAVLFAAAATTITACASIAGLGDTRVLADSSDAGATPSLPGTDGGIDADTELGDGGPDASTNVGDGGTDASADLGDGGTDASADLGDASDGGGGDAASDASDVDAAPSGADTTYPAVVALRHKGGPFFCSGTLIAPQVVLTSARCFPEFANGCAPLHGDSGAGEVDSNEVVLSASGVLGASDNITRDIDDLEAAPSSYPTRRNDCPSGTPLSCAISSEPVVVVNGDGGIGDDGGPTLGDGGDAAVGPPDDGGIGGGDDGGLGGDGGLEGDDGGGLGVRVGSDLLLIHLVSPVPSSIRPIPVLTSLGDDAFDGGSTVHASLDSNPAFANRAQAPQPHIAGWGTPACTDVERRAGAVQFEAVGPNVGDWHKGCTEWVGCDLVPRVDLGCTVTDILGNVSDSLGSYSTNEVRISNTAADSGVFDGPRPPTGDVGSPVFLDGANLAGVPITYAIGTLSVPPAPAATSGGQACAARPGHASSRYSASFTPENGAWIEKTLEYWSGPFYPWNGTWAPWQKTESGTGAIATSPGAESQGSNRVDAFLVGADNSVYGQMWNGHYTYTGVGPISWDAARGTYDAVTSAPAACSWGPDRIDIVARISDGSVMHWWYVDGWLNENLGGYVLPGTGPTIATWGPNNALHVFVVGGDGHLYYKSKIAAPDQNNAGEGWPSDWVDFGAYLANGAASPAAVAWAPGRLDVFTPRTDGALVHLFQDADAQGLGWQVAVLPSPPLAPESGVGVTSWMPGRLDMVVSAAADPSSLVWFDRTSQGWSADAPRTILSGAYPGGTPALASMYPGRLDLFARPPAGGTALYHSWFGSK